MFLKLFVLIVCVCMSEIASFRILSSLSQRSLLYQCQTPTLKNGQVRIRQRGRLARFTCAYSYTVYGDRFAECKSGRWDNPVPHCIKSGCTKLTAPNNSYIAMFNDNASAWLFCKPGYILAGSGQTHCDGSSWDHALGTCRLVAIGPLTWCDFETSDLCGWTVDPTNDLEWKRRNGYVDSSRVRVGPRHDNTIQRPLEGHYMVTESSSQLMNKAARLISPLYQANLSVHTCVRLYYYMYGYMLGRLRVYMKPESVPIAAVLINPKYKLFEKYGFAGNLWSEAVFEMEPLDEDFQIIVEATSGRVHLSDIAIDDFALLTDGDCIAEQYATTVEPLTEEPGGIYDIQSCTNRCDETGPSTIGDEIITNGTGRGGIVEHCDCFDGCEDIKSCCLDYLTVCVFPVTTDTTEVLFEETSMDDIIYTTYDFTDNTKTTTQMTTTVMVTTPSTPTTKATTTTVPTKTTPARTRTNTVKNTILARTTKQTTPKRITLNHIVWPTIPTRRTNPTTITKKTKKLTTRSTTFTTEKPATTSRTTKFILINDSQELTDNVTSTSTTLLAIILSIGIAAVGAIAGYVLWKRFRYDPTNYKSSQHCKNAKEEFSEIRYLTGDEELDFTVQEPKVS